MEIVWVMEVDVGDRAAHAGGRRRTGRRIWTSRELGRIVDSLLL